MGSRVLDKTLCGNRDAYMGCPNGPFIAQCGALGHGKGLGPWDLRCWGSHRSMAQKNVPIFGIPILNCPDS